MVRTRLAPGASRCEVLCDDTALPSVEDLMVTVEPNSFRPSFCAFNPPEFLNFHRM